jgi:propionate CoA-transferase
MDFVPNIDNVQAMDPRIFQEAEMGLSKDLLELDLPHRIAIDPDSGLLFLNFEKMRIRQLDEIERVGRLVSQVCARQEGRLDVIVNYDGFRIEDELEVEWANMVSDLTQRFYRNISRYSGSAFMRMKLRKVFPDARTHIFENSEQARSFLAVDE